MQRLVRFGYIVISTACKSFVCNGVGQYPTSCNSPIAFTGISVSVCLPVGRSQLLQVLHPCSRLLPLLPDIHSYPSSQPLIPLLHKCAHFSYSVISKPSSNKIPLCCLTRYQAFCLDYGKLVFAVCLWLSSSTLREPGYMYPFCSFPSQSRETEISD